MRIVYLLESAAHLWGGVKIALEGANELAHRGHVVLVLSQTGPPTWMDLRCQFQTVPNFAPANIPQADLIVGTDWRTVPAAAAAATAAATATAAGGRSTPVHLVQGYDGSYAQRRADWAQIDAVFGRTDIHKVAISQHLVDTLRHRFGVSSRFVPNMIDHDVMFPAASPRAGQKPIRVGLVGPYLIDWKDLETGYEACRIAAQCGLDLELVRISNSTPAPAERLQPFPVEWHVAVPPRQMGELYRSMDVFLGTSQGSEEGFFLPAVEAMACGTPCVLTEIPCSREYSDEQHALFVPPKDAMEMAQALVLASRHEHVREPLREIGYRTAAKYTAGAHGQALEAAFEDILATTRPASAGPPSILTQPTTTTRIDDSLTSLSRRLAHALRSGPCHPPR